MAPETGLQERPSIQVAPRPASLLGNRWVQLAAGILGMTAVANFQYSWTLFVEPLMKRHGWSRVAVLDALNLYFILAQTWLVPVEGFLADRFGPRRLVVCGGLLAALSWVMCSTTDSLAVLYGAQVLGGCGSGIVYGISVGSALKWFPDRRGLAAGLIAAAWGAGAAVTVIPVAWTIAEAGYRTAFFWFGLGQGAVVVLSGLFMRFPRAAEAHSPQARVIVLQSTRDYTPAEVLKTPAFWLIYLMMTLGAVPGLLMLGQLAPMAGDFGVAGQPLVFLWFTLEALPFALILDRVTGGLTRPAFGWISDHVGREPAIFLAFTLEGASLWLLALFGHDPTMFVVTSGLAFFGWGAVFSLFPAVTGDMFGRKYATTNYGLLYTAKGMATLLVLLANRLYAQSGSWGLVFGLMIAADWIAALLALCVLRPLRKRWAAAQRPIVTCASPD